MRGCAAAFPPACSRLSPKRKRNAIDLSTGRAPRVQHSPPRCSCAIQEQPAHLETLIIAKRSHGSVSNVLRTSRTPLDRPQPRASRCFFASNGPPIRELTAIAKRL